MCRQHVGTTQMVFAVLLLFFLVSCASVRNADHGWTHPTLPQSQWNDDFLDCVTQAENEKPGSLAKDPSGRVRTGEDAFGEFGRDRYYTDQCMEAKGYRHP